MATVEEYVRQVADRIERTPAVAPVIPMADDRAITRLAQHADLMAYTQIHASILSTIAPHMDMATITAVLQRCKNWRAAKAASLADYTPADRNNDLALLQFMCSLDHTLPDIRHAVDELPCMLKYDRSAIHFMFMEQFLAIHTLPEHCTTVILDLRTLVRIGASPESPDLTVRAQGRKFRLLSTHFDSHTAMQRAILLAEVA